MLSLRGGRTRSNGNRTTAVYDKAGRLIASVNPLGFVTLAKAEQRIMS
jgi:hypothetical protein